MARTQLVLLTREWYMHPNGQLPAYEWAFGDVNPPVHAWATWRAFQMDRKQRRETNPNDSGDLAFLERVFHKLMLNFTWWVNRKDAQGRNTGRLEWFLSHRPDLAKLVSRWQDRGMGERRLLSLLRGHRMKCLLRRMLDETEFLSDYGVRALSKVHEREPYRLETNGLANEVRYWPAESESGLFGGNSNWRGPIWKPANYLIIESLQKFHHYYGDDFQS